MQDLRRILGGKVTNPIRVTIVLMIFFSLFSYGIFFLNRKILSRPEIDQCADYLLMHGSSFNLVGNVISATHNQQEANRFSSTRGYCAYNLVGTEGRAVVRVYWERSSKEGAIDVEKVEVIEKWGAEPIVIYEKQK